MLSLPPIPTDSLYKFIFFAGIILTVLASYLESKSVDKYESETYRLDSLKTYATIERDKIDDSIKNGEKVMNDFNQHLTLVEKEINNIEKIRNSAPKVYYHKLDSIKKGFSKMYEERDENAKNRLFINKQFPKKQLAETKLIYIKLKEALKNIDSKSEDKGNYALYIYGIFLTVIGGLLWYFKIQIIQDKLLKMQLIKIEDDLKKARINGRKHFEPTILPRKINGR